MVPFIGYPRRQRSTSKLNIAYLTVSIANIVLWSVMVRKDVHIGKETRLDFVAPVIKFLRLAQETTHFADMQSKLACTSEGS